MQFRGHCLVIVSTAFLGACAHKYLWAAELADSLVKISIVESSSFTPCVDCMGELKRSGGAPRAVSNVTLANLTEVESGWTITASESPLSISIVDNGVLTPRLVRDGLGDLSGALSPVPDWGWLPDPADPSESPPSEDVVHCGDNFMTSGGITYTSNDGWATVQAFRLQSGLPDGPEKCAGQPRVSTVCPIGNRVAVQSSKGLFLLQPGSSEAIPYVNECAMLMRPRLAVGEGTRSFYILDSGEPKTTEVAAGSEDTLIDATLYGEDTIWALRQGQSNVSLWFYEEGTWSQVSTLPTGAPRANPDSVIYTPDSSSPSSVRFTRVERTVEGLFVWGDVLIFSVDEGQTFALLHQGSAVESFHIQNSQYVFLTSDGVAHFGAFGSRPEFSVPARNILRVLIDRRQQPFGISSLARRVEFTKALEVEKRASQATSACPISSVESELDLDIRKLRSPRTPVLLPSVVYIDRLGTYRFSLIVRGSDPAVQFRISDSRFVQLSVDRRQMAVDAVSFTVTLSDRNSVEAPSSQGELHQVTFLSITIPKISACDTVKWGSLTDTNTIQIMTGCPPGYQVRYNFEKSSSSPYCNDPQPGFPCIDFDRDYTPVYDIIDYIGGSVSPFEDNYLLKIQSAGSTASEMEPLDPERFELANKQTWTPGQENIQLPVIAGFPIYRRQLNAVRWICAVGSPCVAITPTFPAPAEVYLNVLLDTSLVNLNTTYCVYQDSVTLRLLGLPVAPNTSIAVFAATMFGGTALAATFAYLGYLNTPADSGLERSSTRG